MLIAATGLPELVVGQFGNVTKWEAWGASISQSQTGTVASVIFSPDPNNVGSYLVTGMDFQTLTSGQNNVFSGPGVTYDKLPNGAGPLLSGGSNAIVPGSIFGLFMIDIKVGNTNVVPPAADLWGRDLALLSGLPTANQSLTITQFGINTNVQPPLNNPTPRTYSYRVTAEIPEPATLWLLGLPLAWVASRRKRGDVAAV